MNAERKQEYLNSLNLEESSKLPIQSLFNRTEIFEERCGLDLCDFPADMLALTFSECGWVSNMSTFNVYRSMTRNYIQWCVAQGYCTDSRIIDNFMPDPDLISFHAFRACSYFSLNDFIQILKDMYITHDNGTLDEQYTMQQATWCLAWLGFTKTEVLSLRKDQVHENSIVTDVWEVRDINPFLMRIIHTACEIQYIIVPSKNGTERKKIFKQTPYVLRRVENVGRYASEEKVQKPMITRWGFAAQKLQQINIDIASPSRRKKISFSKFFDCGRYVALYEWEQEHGVATTANMVRWCALVRRNIPGTSQPKRSTPMFLTSYQQWKQALELEQLAE